MATVFDPQAEPVVDSNVLYEIVDGEIVEKQMSGREEFLGLLLYDLLAAYVVPRKLGRPAHEILFNLAPITCQRRPDVAFISKDRWRPGIGTAQTPAWNVIPNLSVEVVSPSNSMNEVRGKVHEYFAAGVEVVWVVLPEYQEVHVYDAPRSNRILAIEDELTGDPVIPGFRLPLAELFADEADTDDATAE